MNKYTILFLLLIIAGASYASGLFSNFRNDPNAVSASSSKEECLDKGAPIKSKFVKFKGQQYNLIKSEVEVFPSKVDNEMEKTGQTDGPDSKDIYDIKSGLSGTATDVKDVIYVLQKLKGNEMPEFFIIKGVYVFDLYLKDGKDISDNMKNCLITGGLVMVDPEQTSFPPSFIDLKKVIVSGLNPLTSPSYIKSENPKKTIKDIEIVGGKKIGIIVIKTKEYRVYFHNSTLYLIDFNDDAYQYDPSNDEVNIDLEKNTLQMKNIQFVETPVWGWWMPVCKPAIYLYPLMKTQVKVKVLTKGIFTYTNPSYPKEGWEVFANPSGIIESFGKTYPYLYYESMEKDSDFKKPESGFVVQLGELPNFYSSVLPQLGLSDKESKDFIDYWKKALPKSPYYFIGIVDQSDIDSLEPLEIFPKPDSLLRIRLYFEPLDKKINVLSPLIQKPDRKGFTVVEWGGMVKTDKDHPFTCLQ